MAKMSVLVACEFSGIVRDAFQDVGHLAVSCDFLPTESKRNQFTVPVGFHYERDVLEILDHGWDLMIAHPPCTYICNSGVSWLHRQEGRWEKMRLGAIFFKKLLDAPIPRICVENPVMHKYAVEIIGRRQDQSIQPWQFGHDASKRTCLWLKNLPLLVETDVIRKKRYANQTPSGRCNLGPSPDRWKKRSRFYTGVAAAMAEQWGSLE